MSPTIVSEEQTVQIDTLVKGTIDVPEQQIIHFTQALIGFEQHQRFVLLQTDKGPLYWLQAVDNAKVAFAVLAPFQAGLDPDMPLTNRDVDDIGASGLDDIDVYTLLVLDQDPSQIRTNLRAPILIGRSSNKAKQTVLDAPHLPVQFFLRDLLAKRRGA